MYYYDKGLQQAIQCSTFVRHVVHYGPGEHSFLVVKRVSELIGGSGWQILGRAIFRDGVRLVERADAAMAADPFWRNRFIEVPDTEDEVRAHLAIALQEVGALQPRLDAEDPADPCWVVAHPFYPSVLTAANTPQEALALYVHHLELFVRARLDGTLADHVDRTTPGGAGIR